MPDELDFQELLERARSGDSDSMSQIAKHYEDEVRIVARVRLGKVLQAHLDSVDLVQSVHKSLMIGLRDNRFDISSPEKLIALALTIVRRKVARHWRKLKRQQRLSGEGSTGENLADLLVNLSQNNNNPAEQAAQRDSTAHALNSLSELELQVVQYRLDGYSTAEIARLLNQDADVLRVRLSRLRKRLREQGLLNDLL